MATKRITWRPVTIAIMAYLYYRSRDIYFQVVPPALPPQWFAYGNATTSCKIIDGGNSHLFASSSSSSNDGPEAVVNPEFGFCEDMVQWDLVDADGQPQKTKGGMRHLIVGCDPGRMAWNPVMGPLRDPWTTQGSLWLYSYSAGGSSSSRGVPRKLELQGFPKTSVFHPFGIDVVYDPQTAQYRLFVINQGEKASSVEVFTLSRPPASLSRNEHNDSYQQHPSAALVRATYVKTLSHPAFVSPNSLAVVSPTSFYITNDHTLTRRIPYVGAAAHVFETFFKYPGGWVDFVEFEDNATTGKGGEVRVRRAIDHKIPFANGIAMSPNGRTVAVASSTGNSVALYGRNATTNTLTYETQIDLPFHADNLAYGNHQDEHGGATLYASGTPFYPSLIKVAKGKKLYSPSWVVEITPRRWAPMLNEEEGKHFQGGRRVPRGIIGENGPFIDVNAPVPSHARAPMNPSWAVRTVYQSDGSGFSASATGFVDQEAGKMFVSGVYEPRGVLQCE
ncbi:hypothetical protein FRC04_009279 [Tulasnella sp. 424]|nr:hypothetical protein FRC04_009279 [Tulasnella sp. 424]KAG8973099.1 hypothetical protein FRC05_009108 [Tulasnella sp. 425]